MQDADTHARAQSRMKLTDVSVAHPAGCRCSWFMLWPRLGRRATPPPEGFSAHGSMTWRDSVRFGVIRIGGCHGRFASGATFSIDGSRAQAQPTIRTRIALALAQARGRAFVTVHVN